MIEVIEGLLEFLGGIAVVFAAIAFYVWWISPEEKKSRRLTRSPHHYMLRQIAEWAGDPSIEDWCLRSDLPAQLEYKVYFVLHETGILKMADFDEFNPCSFPHSVRPDFWFVKLWDDAFPDDHSKVRLVLCQNEETKRWWRTTWSGQSEGKFFIELIDNLGCHQKIMVDDNSLCWYELMEKTLVFVRSAHSVWHYKLRVLKGEIEDAQT